MVGGEDDPGDPAVVALLLGGFPTCSGTLIGKRTVLTAGHCDIELGVRVTAVVGADVDHGDVFDVVEWARHPDYSGEGNDFDVALARLDRDADPAPLSLSRHALADADVGAALRHVGFGVADEASGDGRGTKRTVTYPITQVTPTLVFSGAAGEQTCDGDSGGPALFVDDDGVERIIAVVSDGPNCHEDGWDARVDSAEPFVDDTVARFEDAAQPPPESCSASGSPAAALVLLAGVVRTRRRRRSALAWLMSAFDRHRRR